MPVPLVENAPAKVNLTLRVLGRRADGYHEISSLVAFADFGDRLSFTPGGELMLTVHGPQRGASGARRATISCSKAARALAARIPGIVPGAVRSRKEFAGRSRNRRRFGRCGRSAAASGAGERSSQATIRAFHEAARATGADVPVCLDPRPRMMHGIGEKLSAAACAAAASRRAGQSGRRAGDEACLCRMDAPPPSPAPPFDLAAVEKAQSQEQFLRSLTRQANDLEDAAIEACAGHRRRSSRRCARSPAAAWPACRAPARRALACSIRPPPREVRRKR